MMAPPDRDYYIFLGKDVGFSLFYCFTIIINRIKIKIQIKIQTGIIQ